MTCGVSGVAGSLLLTLLFVSECGIGRAVVGR